MSVKYNAPLVSSPVIEREDSQAPRRSSDPRWRKLPTLTEPASHRCEHRRLRRLPARLDALYELIDRALVHGTLAETRSCFDRAITSARERRRTISDASMAQRTDAAIRQLQDVQRTLPEFLANREEWRMTQDPGDGHYSIRDRATGAVIRDFSTTKR